MKSFIYIEPSEEGIDSLTKQIALKISKIPVEVRGPLRGISIGNGLEGKASQLSGLFDELIRVEVPSGDELNTELISNILTDVLKESGPAILFLGFTHLGMEVGPAIGWRLQIPTITSCIDFDWTGGEVNVKRPIVGGKLLVSFSVKSERGMVISVQKGVWKDEVSCESVGESVPVTRIPWRNSWAAEKTQWIGISEEGMEGEEDITRSEILVSVGRGLGGPENLPMVKQLAEKLGGLVSCSRPVVDLGWLPPSRQVGISGKSVAPVIYLALGISGQSNHLAGMDGSRIIIAVNKDPLAPIFNVANFGVVDDLLEFVPGLLDQIKQKQG